MTFRNFLFASALLAALPLSAATGADGSKDEGTLAPSGELVPMEAISLPIIDGARLLGTLNFELVLETGEGTSADMLTSEMPVLRAEALAAGAEFSRLSASPFVAVDAQRLSDELTLALRAQQPGIGRVLLVKVTAKSV